MHALPRIEGHWLTAYRLLWAITLAGAFTACVAAQVHALQPVRLIHALVLGGVAAMLFRRRPADPVAAMLSLAFLLWALTRSAVGADSPGVALELLDRVRFALFVVAMMLFPEGRFNPSWIKRAVFVALAITSIGMLAAVGLVRSLVYVAPAMGCAALAVFAMSQRFRALPPGVQRQQIKWVALGLAAGLAFVLASKVGILFLPAAVADILFDLGVIVIALGVLVSLLRYRLYDADAAISRSVAYAALTVALLAVFGASEAVIQIVSQDWLGEKGGSASGAIAAGVAAAMVAPAHQVIGNWTQAHFQRRLTQLTQRLPELLEDLREFADLRGLGDEALKQLEVGLRPVRSALIFQDRVIAARHIERKAAENWFSGVRLTEAAPPLRNADPLFTVRYKLTIQGNGTIGWLLLGPRPDGTAFSRDEHEALVAILPVASRTLYRAWSRGRSEAAAAEHADLVRRELESLSRRLRLLENSGSITRTIGCI